MTGNILDIWPKQFSRCLVKGDWIEDFSFTDVNSQCFYLYHVSVVLLSLLPPKFSFLFQYDIQPSPYFSAMIVRIHSKKKLSSPTQSEAIRVSFQNKELSFPPNHHDGCVMFCVMQNRYFQTMHVRMEDAHENLEIRHLDDAPRPVPSHLCC